MKEHYGLELAESSIRIVAQRHAHNIKEFHKSIQVYKPDNLLGKEITIAQTDGAMVPIVTIMMHLKEISGQQEKQSGKSIALLWQEKKVRLLLFTAL